MGTDRQTEEAMGRVIGSSESIEDFIRPTADDPYRPYRQFNIAPIGPDDDSSLGIRTDEGLRDRVVREVLAQSLAGAKMYASLIEGIDNGHCHLAGPVGNDDRCEIIDSDGRATGFYVDLEYAKRRGVTDYRNPEDLELLGQSEPISESASPVLLPERTKVIDIPSPAAAGDTEWGGE